MSVLTFLVGNLQVPRGEALRNQILTMISENMLMRV